MSARRGKWQLQPPSSPRIIHLPRRSSLFRSTKLRAKLPAAVKQNLRVPMLQENCRLWEDKRMKVESTSSTGEIAGDSSEERRRFQADVRGAECNFIRTGRKLERNRAQNESEFRSAVETMISRRKKLDGRGGISVMALNEGIGDLQAKPEEIDGGFRCSGNDGGHAGNIDRRALALRRPQAKTMLEEVRKIDQISESVSPKAVFKAEFNDDTEFLASDRQHRFTDVENLRTKMEGLSGGMRKRMEEHGVRLQFTDREFAAGGSDNRHVRLLQGNEFEPGKKTEKRVIGSCCKCKELVEKIANQIMEESDEWDEMQAMLEKVKTDMEDLRSSKDRWERRALSAELNLRSLHSQTREWKTRAVDSEKSARELRRRIAQSSAHAGSSIPRTLSDQLYSEICRLKQLKIREKKQKLGEAAKEKHDEVFRRRPALPETGILAHKDYNAMMFR